MLRCNAWLVLQRFIADSVCCLAIRHLQLALQRPYRLFITLDSAPVMWCNVGRQRQQLAAGLGSYWVVGHLQPALLQQDLLLKLSIRLLFC